jgi:hypothetical protein
MAGQGLQSLPLKLLVTMMTSAPNLLALSLLATPTRIQKLLPRTPSLGVKKKPQKRTFKNKRKSKKGDKKRGDFGSDMWAWSYVSVAQVRILSHCKG